MVALNTYENNGSKRLTENGKENLDNFYTGDMPQYDDVKNQNLN